MRKKGAAKAAKKAGRIASEGMIQIEHTVNSALIVEVNCETDFVSSCDDFRNFITALAKAGLQAKTNDVATLATLTLPDGHTVEEARLALITKLGENISIRRIGYLQGQGKLSTYSHGSRIGVIVDIETDKEEFAKDIAMHIAASHPMVVSPDEVPADDIEKEKEIFRAQAEESGKPPEIIEKMIAGRINKYFNEVTLLGQSFVKDPNVSIEQLLTTEKATVHRFIRYEVGEGIEKKADNFVEEVMAQARGN